MTNFQRMCSLKPRNKKQTQAQWMYLITSLQMIVNAAKRVWARKQRQSMKDALWDLQGESQKLLSALGKETRQNLVTQHANMRYTKWGQGYHELFEDLEKIYANISLIYTHVEDDNKTLVEDDNKTVAVSCICNIISRFVALLQKDSLLHRTGIRE